MGKTTDELIDNGKCSILGVDVDIINYTGAVHRVITAAHEQRPCSVSALAVHGVMTGVQDTVHRYRLNHLDLVVPDGQPVRWALNLLHKANLPDRVYGPTLMVEICKRAASDGLPVYLYGSTSDVLERLTNNLCERIPGLQIAGVTPSQFRQLDAEEQESINTRIRDSGARIVFVGIGCPRQEVWAYENSAAIGVPIIAVGAAFAFHAGSLSQAPAWMQTRGLEWLYRLVKEPRRLWKRYVVLNPIYATMIFAQWLGVLKLSITNEEVAPGTPLRYG